jgi:signal transduction histidine kinase
MDLARTLRPHADALLAIALSVALQVQIWLGLGLSSDEADEAVGPLGEVGVAALALAGTASLAWRRRWPLVPLALAYPVLAVSGSGGVDGVPALVLVLMVAAYTAGAETRDTAAILGALGVAGLIALALGRDPDAVTSLGDAVVPILLIGGSWIAGLATRLRRDQAAATEARAAALERDHEARAREAVQAERTRIARDLHDVVAHALSIVVVQARGGRHRLATDRAATEASLTAIEDTAVEALAEMRRLLGILEAGGHDPAERTPQPGLADLERLAGQMREAGLEVVLVVEGDPRRVPPGVDLSAYRIVQEALTNTLRHAGPASARVVVRYGDVGAPSIDLEIADTGRSEPSDPRTAPIGRGLIGMRERAALVGGVVEAGPVDGGYVVRAHLPIAPTPA